MKITLEYISINIKLQKVHTAAIFLYYSLVSPPSNLNILVTGPLNSNKDS
jgi:hypothetical protein